MAGQFLFSTRGEIPNGQHRLREQALTMHLAAMRGRLDPFEPPLLVPCTGSDEGRALLVGKNIVLWSLTDDVGGPSPDPTASSAQSSSTR